jgi:cell wall assembly regulator SMI1
VRGGDGVSKAKRSIFGSVESAWRRIKAWYAANVPPDCFRLLPGASEEQIADTERKVGLRFPDPVRESYRMHNGSGEHAVFEYGFALLSLDEIARSLAMWRSHVAQGLFADLEGKPDGPIKPYWWNPKWFPVTHNNGGDHHCVDLDPMPGGAAGQVIKFSHEVGPQCVLADGWLQRLSEFADALDTGTYRFDVDELWLVPKK